MYDLWLRQYIACTELGWRWMLATTAVWTLQMRSLSVPAVDSARDDGWLCRMDSRERPRRVPEAVVNCAAALYSRRNVNLEQLRVANDPCYYPGRCGNG